MYAHIYIYIYIYIYVDVSISARGRDLPAGSAATGLDTAVRFRGGHICVCVYIYIYIYIYIYECSRPAVYSDPTSVRMDPDSRHARVGNDWFRHPRRQPLGPPPLASIKLLSFDFLFSISLSLSIYIYIYIYIYTCILTFQHILPVDLSGGLNWSSLGEGEEARHPVSSQGRKDIATLISYE